MSLPQHLLFYPVYLGSIPEVSWKGFDQVSKNISRNISFTFFLTRTRVFLFTLPQKLAKRHGTEGNIVIR